MTTSTEPFLLQFGEVLPRADLPPVVYDPARQVSRVQIEGRWVDVADCGEAMLGGGTKKTGVGQETTDDD